MSRWTRRIVLAVLGLVVASGVVGCSIFSGGGLKMFRSGQKQEAEKPKSSQTVADWLGQPRPDF